MTTPQVQTAFYARFNLDGYRRIICVKLKNEASFKVLMNQDILTERLADFLYALIFFKKLTGIRNYFNISVYKTSARLPDKIVVVISH